MKLTSITLSCALVLLSTLLQAHAETEESRWTNSLGLVFVSIPETQAKFCVWETRVRDYAVFVREGSWSKTWPLDPHFRQTTNDPVVNVSWEEAKDFCIWLTQRERAMGLISTNRVYRLPSDLEWSRCAGLGKEIGDTAEKRTREFNRDPNKGYEMKPASRSKEQPEAAGNYGGKGDGYQFTSPVGSFPQNKYGLFDMQGNVWEWCLDFADDGRRHILRGGSWATGAVPLACRDFTLPNNQMGDYGFRLVLAEGEIRL